MPIYSYKCKNCGEIFDKHEKSGGNGKVKCVHCQSDTQRIFSPVGIIFKGSGFYSTDYKSGSKSAKVADNSSSSTTSSKKNGDKEQDISSASNKEKTASSQKAKSDK
ncbi:MAG: FmdB family transcriptional regulator [Actinobacteria bacterium]|nr:FmdB family transcriptional regulator [Actinomycetota bacterium]